ncbi:heterodimeric methylmalonyl-CoA mutase small subunit [Actinomadura pelletieri DSM 43383]|uniref:methylmalonyl-CoA mutase n=1 Tax=Actinomadura pelletieri DSM 43383 TaxID=1120940 RepID=A0A495QM72_9ACTN|nr:methylmalonyl-CoA mutase family protein [Actinomadura pelletieri]RKS73702.1 heterodimeric methylmalonyl-CoA mutase small subunit [Actinomadura pelletieri DSM 43383]
MTVPPERLELAAAFPPAERDRWREMVKGVLRKSGAATEDTPLDEIEGLLTRDSYDGVPIAPLYTREDAPPGRPGLDPYVREVRPDGEGIAGWDVRQLHAHPDPAVTRDAILADLENGATSVWLRLGGAAGGLPVTALPEALRGVRLDLAPVVLDAGARTTEAADAFLALAAERGNAADVSGNLGADPLGLAARTGTPGSLDEAAALAARCVREFPRLRAVVADGTPYHDAGGADAEELGAAVAAGVAYLRALTGAGLGVDEAFAQIEFRLAVHADQFASIAKLRAARRLWARVAEVSGAAAGTSARIHAVTSSAMMTRRDPWVNMLRTTLAAFAAGVGGADAVTVQPFDARLGLPDDFARRIARNTQTLLLEESSLARVVDPAGGSWYVESLTEGLAKAAWAWFTEIEKAGGLAAALASGLVADRLAATWARRRADIARRKAPLTGVSEYPHLAETLPERVPAPPAPGGGLPVVAYAQDFEALRDRSDAHTEASGTRPRVFLATLGPIAVHTARASFAANLFQAGGVETVTGAPEEFGASGTTVACICSSDGLYEERAAETARVLREAGAVKVWLAGKGTYEGVDRTLHAGCDAIDVLETTLRDLGVNE